MQRERATRILTRIAEELTRGPFMAVPLKLFAFGSYARGALAPEDLDLLLLWDHPADHRERLDAQEGDWHSIGEMLRKHPEAQYMAEFKKRLRKPGEKIDLLVYHPKSDFAVGLFAGRQTIKPDDLRLVWRKGDKTAWRGRIEALKPDPEAGRSPRKQLFPLKRLAEGLPYMDMAVAMIERRQLRYRFIPLESAPVRLTKKQRQHMDFLVGAKSGRPLIGREAGRLLPYLYGWVKACGGGDLLPGHDLVAIDQSLTLRAHLGRPSLRAMVRMFKDRPQLKRQALIPYIKRGDVNGIMEFERGERWNDQQAAEWIERADFQSSSA